MFLKKYSFLPLIKRLDLDKLFFVSFIWLVIKKYVFCCSFVCFLHKKSFFWRKMVKITDPLRKTGISFVSFFFHEIFTNACSYIQKIFWLWMSYFELNDKWIHENYLIRQLFKVFFRLSEYENVFNGEKLIVWPKIAWLSNSKLIFFVEKSKWRLCGWDNLQKRIE